MGWPSVALGTFGGEVRLVDVAGSRGGKQRVVIVEDPEQDPWPTADTLRLGSRVKSWILLDEVALGWEMWRIINGFPLSIPEEYAPGGAKAHDSKKTKPSAKAY